MELGGLGYLTHFLSVVGHLPPRTSKLKAAKQAPYSDQPTTL